MSTARLLGEREKRGKAFFERGIDGGKGAPPGNATVLPLERGEKGGGGKTGFSQDREEKS